MRADAFSDDFEIHPYPFSKETISRLEKIPWVKQLWPLVYILSNQELGEAYVGESTNAISRLSNHLAKAHRRKLSRLHLITSSKFNKSATLDIEANLIRYISADGRYKLQNGNAGIANHSYFQQEEYHRLFQQVWSRLQDEDISLKSLQEIDNSDLFKYSPYKSLTTDQYESIKEIVQVLVSGSHQSVIVNGSAGTGKTILAIFLMKLLVTPVEEQFEEEESQDLDEVNLVASLKQKYQRPKVALVVPMTSLRNTLKEVFKSVSGLSARMVIGPTEVSRQKYDILIVDEAHRLKRRKNLTGYESFDQANARLGLDKAEGTELDWILLQSKHQIFFYDAAQSIKPTDIPKERFEPVVKQARLIYLRSQLRVRAGQDYIAFVDKLLHNRFSSDSPAFYSDDYELLLFYSFADMVARLQEKEAEMGLARLVAGFSWKWKSRKEDVADIEIQGIKLNWNKNTSQWVNSINAANEVGCIHTTQGYDLNYTGVIFGHEIGYDPNKDEIIIRPEHYHDKKGKAGIEDRAALKAYIINIYKTLMYRGIRGTYVYVCDEQLSAYLSRYIPAARSGPKLQILSYEEVDPYVDSVPLYSLEAAAGPFIPQQRPELMKWVKLPLPYRPGKGLFVCRVVGESMNRVIPNGSWCLFKQATQGSREGKIVLVEQYDIQDPDFGSGFTIKEYHSTKIQAEDGWQHDSIELRPLSDDDSYSSIILSADQLQGLRLVGELVCVLN